MLYADEISTAKELFDVNEKYHDAIAIFEKHQDSPEANYYLGKAYYYGLGVDKDYKKAFESAYKSAAEKFSPGLNLLGVLYENGYGIDKNEAKAFSLYKEAANLGDPKAMSNLSKMFYSEKYLAYSLSYEYIVKAAQLGQFYNTPILYDLIRNNLISSEKKDEAISLLIKAANPSINKTKSLHESQYQLYRYYQDTNQSLEAMKLATLAYNNGNWQVGCLLSNDYEMNFNTFEYLDQSYSIASNIINNNPPSLDLTFCYYTLADLYIKGNYVVQDTHKAIELLKTSFQNIDNNDHFTAAWIAKLYFNLLNDYTNGTKWYQVAYNISKDPKYLNEIEKYTQRFPQIENENKLHSDNYLYLFIENFNKSEQIMRAIESKKYYFVATDQKSIRLYDKQTLALLKELRGPVGKGLDGITTGMAYDERTELLYTTGVIDDHDPEKNAIIRVFDIKTGLIVKTLKDANSFVGSSLNISEDGKYLVSYNNASEIKLINTVTNELQKYKVSGIKFINACIYNSGNDYIASVLTDNNQIYNFSVKKKRQISKEKFRNQLAFKTLNTDSLKNIFKNSLQNIADLRLENNKLYINYNDSLENEIKIFDMKNLSLSSDKKTIISNEINGPTLTLKILNEDTTLEVFKNGIKSTSIEFGGSEIFAARIIDDRYIVVTTNDLNGMYIFNSTGRAIAHLQGFSSYQFKLSYQDNYLITYGEDNIIHFWDISKLALFEQSQEEYDQKELLALNKYSGYNMLDAFKIEKFEDKFLEESKTLRGWKFIPNSEQIKKDLRRVLLKKEEIYPLASLYIKNDDWIVFDHNGLFASSPNGTDLIRYHQNQGYDKEARIVNNSQVFEKFYRPDLIKKKLSKEKVDIDLNVSDVIARLNPPEVIIIKEKKIDPNNLEVTYKVCDRGSGISGATLIVNGISITPTFTRGFKIESLPTTADNCTFYKNIVTLKSGVNSIEFKAFDASKTISAKSNTITGTGQAKKNGPSDLYFVSIAVSDYEDRLLKLNFPVNDVLAVKEKIEKKGKVLFGNIHTFNLHNNDATKDKLDSLFTNLSKEIKTDDVLVVYFAGHGITSDKDGLYYFYPYNLNDVSHTGLKKDAISVNDIKSQLSKTQAYNSLILFDTCNSGGVIDSIIENQMIHRLSQDNRRNFIAASSSDEPAYEGYKGHGVFTYAVLDAFDQAYSSTQTTLTTTNLAGYVKALVPKITFENWHYEQTPQTSLNGDEFEIGVK